MNLGDLVCHRRKETRKEKGIGIIIITDYGHFGDRVGVYWFKEGKEQRVWKQILQYAK